MDLGHFPCILNDISICMLLHVICMVIYVNSVHEHACCMHITCTSHATKSPVNLIIFVLLFTTLKMSIKVSPTIWRAKKTFVNREDLKKQKHLHFWAK